MHVGGRGIHLVQSPSLLVLPRGSITSTPQILNLVSPALCHDNRGDKVLQQELPEPHSGLNSWHGFCSVWRVGSRKDSGS